MISGVVVDACVMQRFLVGLIGATATEETKLISCIEAGLGFVVDERHKILTQWRETCSHLVMEDWITQGVQRGTIKAVGNKTSQQHKKALVQQAGFPYSERHEGTYVEVAAVAPPHLLVTIDIDFWEPAAKGKPTKQKQKIIASGKGGVRRYLKRNMGVTVLTPGGALEVLTC
jgi:hypothetical protein